MPRIAIAGFQHETNSFSGQRAGLAEFEMADSWPGLLEGKDVIEKTRGMNLPIAGAAAAAIGDGYTELAPILWCAAEPSGNVTSEAFDVIASRMLEGLRASGPLDGLYLDLHGAMITDDDLDGEAALLELIRGAFGADFPIAISLDLHANLTRRLVSLATSISVFRTYPHLDMAQTGARAFRKLLAHMDGARHAKVLRPWPYLVPLHAQWTGAEPLRGIYRLTAETPGAELAMGFTAGDTPETGPALLVQRATQDDANRVADTLFERCLAAEKEFSELPLPPGEAVREALSAPEGRPVVLADVEDNAGGGGASDTTGLLRALVEEGAKEAILGVLHDPKAAAEAHAKGAGAKIEIALGGRSGAEGDVPFVSPVEVLALSDGSVTYEGEMYGGGVAQMGPTALLRIVHDRADVQIVVSSVRNQCLDRAYFRHIGLTPEAVRLIVVKSTVHFRAEFDPIAQQTVLVAVPGALKSDLSKVPYQHLRSGVRLGPGGPNHKRMRGRH